MAAARADGHRSEQLVRAVARWAEDDASRALHAADLAAIRTTEAARWLVLDHFRHAAPARDLFSACARLGALIAEAGGSPSLAAGSIDGALRALDDAGAPFDDARVAPARASLFEGYVAAVRDDVRTEGLASWEWPSCAVPLGDDLVALACGYPSDDGDARALWAARIAGRLVKAKVRRVILSGHEAAKAEVASAVELVGIAIVTDVSARERRRPSPETKRWLRLPWWK